MAKVNNFKTKSVFLMKNKKRRNRGGKGRDLNAHLFKYVEK